MPRLLMLIALVGCRETTSTTPAPVPSEIKPLSPKPEPPPVKPALDGKCSVDADCMVTSLRDDCCDHCGEQAVSTASYSLFRNYCQKLTKNCPAIDCPYQPAKAVCTDHHCTKVIK